VTKKSITQRSSDNTYFHKDFHIALNYGLEYLNKKFGEFAVDEYLKQFTNNYHKILKKSLQGKGLSAIQEHYEKIFKIEGAKFNMMHTQAHQELNIYLHASTAVLHIKKKGHTVYSAYSKTITVVNKELCRNTPYDCKLIDYEQENGAYHIRFFKREK